MDNSDCHSPNTPNAPSAVCLLPVSSEGPWKVACGRPYFPIMEMRISYPGSGFAPSTGKEIGEFPRLGEYLQVFTQDLCRLQNSC